MERNQKFYFCPHCGNLVVKVIDSKVPLVCCGEEMVELECNTVDGVKEKHVPMFKVEKCNMDKCKVVVDVGSEKHPMSTEHYIQWICIKTKRGWQIQHLKPGDVPSACFAICNDDSLEEVYAYCNLHGLWMG